jgi:uncharacterized protein with PIN domain
MNPFRRSFVKCFYCKTKVDKKKSFVVEYRAADGFGSFHVCENCSKDLNKLATNMKELYDE